jgi:hypothetical protein
MFAAGSSFGSICGPAFRRVGPVLSGDSGSGDLANGFEVIAPEFCPWQTREQQKQGKACDPQPDNGVQVAPE